MTPQRLTLKQVAESLPSFDGGTVSVKTVRRWCSSGCGGVVLQSERVGGRRYTTQEWLDSFREGCTTKADGPGRSREVSTSSGHAGAMETLRKRYGYGKETNKKTKQENVA